MFPDNPYVREAYSYFSAGLAAEAQEKWQEAAVCFDKATTLDHQQARSHTHLAWCLAQLTRYDKALETIKYAEKYAQADDYLIYLDIGKVYYVAGKYTQARRAYETSLAIFPDFEAAKAALWQTEDVSARNK